MSNNIIEEHVRGLIQKGKTEYKAFELLTGVDWPEEEAAEARKYLTCAVDLHIKEELNVGEGFFNTVKELLAMDFKSKQLLLKCWWECLDSAQPHRKLMKETASGFVSTLREIQPLHPDYMAFVPMLFQYLKKEGRDTLPRLSEIVGQALTEEKYWEYFEFLEPYMPYCPPRVFRGLMEIGAILLPNGTEQRTQLESLCPADEEFEENTEMHKYLSSMGDTLAAVQQDNKKQILDLGLCIGSRSMSSSAHVMKDLKARVPEMEPGLRAVYLDAFLAIIEKVGVGAITFCSNKLPGLLDPAARENTKTQLDTLAAIADQYGSHAAFEYLEKL